MNYFQGFRLGLKSYSEALSFIKIHKLGWFFLFPVLLNIALFLIGFYSVGNLGDDLLVHLNGWLAIDSWNFWGASFLAGAIKWLVWIVLRLMFFILFAYVGGYIIMILLSPVYAYLSEKTEGIILGKDWPFNLKQFLSDMIRGIGLAVRNLIVELLFTLLLVVFSFIPLVGWLSSIALVLLSAYFYGFSFMDYTFERHRFNVSQSVQYMRSNKGLAVGNGLVFSLVLLIPFVGVTLAGFFSIVSLVGATIAANKALQ